MQLRGGQCLCNLWEQDSSKCKKRQSQEQRRSREQVTREAESPVHPDKIKWTTSSSGHLTQRPSSSNITQVQAEKEAAEETLRRREKVCKSSIPPGRRRGCSLVKGRCKREDKCKVSLLGMEKNRQGLMRSTPDKEDLWGRGLPRCRRLIW